jgi:hypothetical protein
MKVNLSTEDYYTQRNNKIKPMAACMPTSYVMFLKGNNIHFGNSSGLQDDDYFMSILNTDNAKNFCLKKYPWSKGIPPNEIHGAYGSYLDFFICGKRVSDFNTHLQYDHYLELLEQGRVIMTSGSFPGLSGHAFCIIGIHGDDLILADPWGDFHSGYKDHAGYGIRMNREEFRIHVKPTGSERKWGHIILEG